MLNKIKRFEDIAGHENLVEYFLNHINNETLPQFIILDGEEGLGKSSFAKLLALGVCCESEHKPCYECPSCKAIMNHVIDKNESTDNVMLYNMSIEGGKESAKSVLANMNLGFAGGNNKVIIMDEAHAMSDAAQDVFLVDTEYLPKGVYVFLATTNTMNLSKTLRSRAITIPLHRLSNKEMVILLRKEVIAKGLTVQNENKTLDLIAAWADGKPRIALNLLNSFSPNSVVSSNLVKELTRTTEIDDVLQIVEYLGGSMTHGIVAIQESHFDESIFSILTEILRIKKGFASFKLSMDESINVKRAVAPIPEDNLIKFVYEVAALQTMSTRGITAAFIKSHINYESMMTHSEEILNEELNQKANVEVADMKEQKRGAPSIEELLKSGSIVED